MKAELPPKYEVIPYDGGNIEIKRTIKVGNGVSLETYLVKLDEQFCELGQADPIEVRVITGHDFNVLVGFGPTSPELMFTDGKIVSIEEDPNPKYTTREEPYLLFRVEGAATYVAWWAGSNAREDRKVNYYIQTPLKAPDFRSLIKDIDLQNINFRCEFWGPRNRDN